MRFLQPCEEALKSGPEGANGGTGRSLSLARSGGEKQPHASGMLGSREFQELVMSITASTEAERWNKEVVSAVRFLKCG